MNEELLRYVERIEKLEEDKKEIQDDIKSVYDEASGKGFDKKALKEVLKLRKMTPSDRAEFEFLRQKFKTETGIEE